MQTGKRRALISVDDKSNLVDFARGLLELNFEIISTGKTKAVLDEAKIAAQSVADVTNFPEILDGRVKTLHPAIHAGILANRENPEHMATLQARNFRPIDLVVSNLYPFAQTIAQPNVTLAEAIEKIDIGGPTLIRAAAKNFMSVLIVTSPADYVELIQLLKAGEVSPEFRQKLAVKAFQHVAYYDSLISQYLRTPGEHFPDQLTIALDRVQGLRYGENPHQLAAFYSWKSGAEQRFAALNKARQIQGKELSYNNILDADAALNVVRDFTAPTIAIIKHTNPCGLASNNDLVVAFERALAGDPLSAYGGIVASNRPIDGRVAQKIVSSFYEVVIAPEFTSEAEDVLRKKKSLRLLTVGDIYAGADQLAMTLEMRPVAGGFLAQTRDALQERDMRMDVMTSRSPSLEEVTNLRFAWRAVKHIKSNAIVLIKNHAIVGMGSGQPSRVDAVKIALGKAGVRGQGSVLASDAYFPKVDGVETAALGGVTAIIQPGGSISDTDVLEMANRHNLAMVFTGTRHFKH